MRRWLWKLVNRMYVGRSRDVVKLTETEEFTGALLADPDASLKLIRSLLTLQTILYFEESSDEGRWMRKGAALALRLLRDYHTAATKIVEFEPTPKGRLELWTRAKAKFIK